VKYRSCYEMSSPSFLHSLLHKLYLRKYPIYYYINTIWSKLVQVSRNSTINQSFLDSEYMDGVAPIVDELIKQTNEDDLS